MFLFLREFFADFTRLKLFLLVFFFLLAALALSFWLGGFLATAVVIIPATLSILQITKEVWSPEGGAKSKIGLASLGVATLALGSSPLWKSHADTLLKPLLEKYPSLKEMLPADAPSIATLIFLVVVIFIVNYFARDTSAMKEHPTPVDKEFPERDYRHYLKGFTGVLLEDLNKIDRETNWSAEIFTPLDAEVEVQSGTKRQKRVIDLLTAIRSDRKSKVFLILGVPGSGKSVALRKLCRDLLREVEKTRKVPLYVNLREWEPKEKWTEESPPTIEQLYDFVITNLKNRGDVFTNDFLEKYFKQMFRNGRLFFVLDSFDEIPAVLDVDERSWLIDKLSEITFRFLSGAHESRGILASRIFRRPTDKFDVKTILEIRPFTEAKIAETLQKSVSYDQNLLELLFNTRQEFIAIARNPFTSALISSYAKENNNTLPQTQADLYSTYIQRRLESCHEKIKAKGLNTQKVIECSTEIADVMLTTEVFGLEAPIKELAEALPHLPVSEAIDVLKYSRLGRLGSGDEQRFSFVHRRFNEYFVVQKLKAHPERVPQDAIPTDSRWRDALVLYCEIADEDNARNIAEFCWSEVKKLPAQSIDMRTTQFLRSVHCLRFLKEAFRARLGLVSSFQRELSLHISNQLAYSDNLLSQKIAVEAVGLLKETEIDKTLTRALNLNNPWIDETAFKSCYYLPRLSKDLIKRLQNYFGAIDSIAFLQRRKELMFSLSLSNAFGNLTQYCKYRLLQIYVFIAYCIILCFLSPLALLSLITIYIILQLLKHALPFFKPSSNRAAFNNIESTAIIFASSVILNILRDNGAPLTLIHIYPRYLKFLLIIAMIPWGALIIYVPELFRAIEQWEPNKLIEGLTIGAVLKSIKALLYTSLIFGGIVAAFMGVAFLLESLLSPMVGYIFLGGIGVFLLSLVLFGLTKYLQLVVADYKILKSIENRMFLTREPISQQFFGLKTQRGRLKFVQLLQKSMVKPDGLWPKGELPNIDDDEASTLLAQLEEKWLGL